MRWIWLIVALLWSTGVHAQEPQRYRANFDETRAKVEDHLRNTATDFKLLLRDTRVLQEEECRLLVLVSMPPSFESELESYIEKPKNGFDRIDAWPGSIDLNPGANVVQVGSTDFGVYVEKGGPKYMAWSINLVPKAVGNHMVQARPVVNPPSARAMKSVTVTAVTFWPAHLTRAVLLALFVMAFAVLVVVPPIMPSAVAAVATAFLGWCCLPAHPVWRPLFALVVPAAIMVYSFKKGESVLEVALTEHRSAAPEFPGHGDDPPPAVVQINAVRKRAEWMVKASAHRARWQLSVGIATGVAAVLFLLGATVPLGRAGASDFRSDSALVAVTRGLPYVLCFGCLVVTATFLVKQYRSSLDDVRYFERAQRLRESQVVAVAVAQGLTAPDDIAKKTIEILAWGESSSAKSKESETPEEKPKPQ